MYVFVLPETMGDNDIVVDGTLPQLMSSCLATMDTFLQQQYPVVSSVVIAEKHKPADSDKVGLVDAIANILGIKDANSVNADISLADLGMDSLMGTEIKQILERNYDIVLSPHDIRVLTIGKLRDMSSGTGGAVKEQESSAVARKNSSGSPVNSTNDMLLMQWPSDELLPKETLVRLNTKSSKGPALFIVHAIEGLTKALEHMAGELERPLWGLQSVEAAPVESIPELAKFYLNKVRKVQSKGPYHLAGYSFGTLVALEMAVQLESVGEKVVLTFIDGSPIYMRQHLEMIGKIDINDDITSDGCMKALAYFSMQLNKNVSFVQVSRSA